MTDIVANYGKPPFHFTEHHIAAKGPSEWSKQQKKSEAKRMHYTPGKKIVAIGASTGGVEAIATVLSGFPKNCPPTVITQHMPTSFCAGFVERLDRLCAPSIQIARDSCPLEPGKVLIAPGGDFHLTVSLGRGLTTKLSSGPKTSGHRPSVDELFRSCAILGNRAIGVILTGMGKDGAKGLREMRRQGAYTIGQDEESCVVYGMPRAAAECGALSQVSKLSDISQLILENCRQKRKYV